MKHAPLKLGYKASAEQFGPTELLEYGVLAESLGLDSVWTSDHFQPWRHTGGHAPFSLAWLGALGARTSRVLIGTSVLTPTFRYHPSVVAHAFGTLGSLFPGRVILGIGTGESLNEVPASGMVWPEQKERTARFKEAVDLIRRLWTEERLSYEGTYYRTEKATIYDRPALPVPIYIAGAGPVMAKFAGEKGEGFICTSGKQWELYTDTLLPNLDAGIAKAGKRPGDVDRMIEIKLSFDTDRERALQDTRYWGALALKPEEKVNVEDPIEMEKLADALPVERAASRWIVSSDADEAVAAIARYIDLGFNHLVFHAPGPDQARFLELFSERIAPKLRAAHG
ncbi:MAG TPA: glucose-6-phosphate dehydrogenase (coenzyme-F420) [Povalibacter sp.]|uniref:glucose-6-phosphate dehydrogenase (coenzyme-F420) n=1 Tax=Povalibacter sp. TaxID=1962978 RepID=UPI002C4A0B50|nr:glucose-6-phosphate dehydrogenase (coenzyme-F420) [Povalibacter sp.]HMN46880.1 glucose-6-phosphate dehydrogenase (coenzyme-F420) [Povalibacter sp.]